MEKVKFIYPHLGAYGCDKSGDQSGEYIRAEVAEELLAALQKFVAWNAKYPSSRIYNETDIRKIAKELDTINEDAVAAIVNAKR